MTSLYISAKAHTQQKKGKNSFCCSRQIKRSQRQRSRESRKDRKNNCVFQLHLLRGFAPLPPFLFCFLFHLVLLFVTLLLLTSNHYFFFLFRWPLFLEKQFSIHTSIQPTTISNTRWSTVVFLLLCSTCLVFCFFSFFLPPPLLKLPLFSFFVLFPVLYPFLSSLLCGGVSSSFFFFSERKKKKSKGENTVSLFVCVCMCVFACLGVFPYFSFFFWKLKTLHRPLSPLPFLNHLSFFL